MNTQLASTVIAKRIPIEKPTEERSSALSPQKKNYTKLSKTGSETSSKPAFLFQKNPSSSFIPKRPPPLVPLAQDTEIDAKNVAQELPSDHLLKLWRLSGEVGGRSKSFFRGRGGWWVKPPGRNMFFPRKCPAFCGFLLLFLGFFNEKPVHSLAPTRGMMRRNSKTSEQKRSRPSFSMKAASHGSINPKIQKETPLQEKLTHQNVAETGIFWGKKTSPPSSGVQNLGEKRRLEAKARRSCLQSPTNLRTLRTSAGAAGWGGCFFRGTYVFLMD